GIPELARSVLSDRIRRINSYHEGLSASKPMPGTMELGSAHKSLWAYYLSNAPSSKGGAGPVGPLLNTAWHQNAPYFNLCPLDATNNQTLVGCVATAIAQIMKYYHWPLKGVGSHRYTWTQPGFPDQIISGYYSDPYNWGTTGNPAEISFEVGTAVEMQYGNTGSKPPENWGWLIANQIPTHFRYENTIMFHFRDLHTLVEWYELVQQDIDDLRPMLYTIFTDGISAPVQSHMVVCDGYQISGSGLYQIHLNFGWGPNNLTNAFFTIDAFENNVWPNHKPEDDILISGIIPRIRVAKDGSGSFSTIQEAINHLRSRFSIPASCPKGLKIAVAPGTYNERVDFLGLPITLQSEAGPAVTIIDGLSGGSVVKFVNGETTDSVLDGFTITNGKTNGDTYERGGGICCIGSAPTIINNFIHGNEAGQGGGISCKSGCALIVNNTIVDNITYPKGGITEAKGGGIFLKDFSNSAEQPVIQNNILRNNTAQTNPQLHGGMPEVKNCNLEGGYSGEGVAVDCIDEDPKYRQPGDYRLAVDSPCINRGWNTGAPLTDGEGDARPEMGTVDIGADEYVGTHILAAEMCEGAPYYLFRFDLNAGLSHALREFLLLGSYSGTNPGTPLSGGLVTLPLNMDAFTDFIMLNLNHPAFADFTGILDARGEAVAYFMADQLGVSNLIGLVLSFAYMIVPQGGMPYTFVSNPVNVEVIP
ncbi:MAG: C10 family peptidase, partial [Planctomycetota bacterium]